MGEFDVERRYRDHFEYPKAFEHNREFKMNASGSKLKGCHDLRSLLNAQARGLVVASVKETGGENLPQGVWVTMLACRRDIQDPPNSAIQQAVAPCPGPRGTIQFKNDKRLILKTVYDPCVWSDNVLAKCCVEARNDANSMGRYEKDRNNGYSWEGKFVIDGRGFWIHGYSSGGNDLLTSRIKNFYFVHPDNLELDE